MYEQLTKALYSVESIAVFMHVKPDGDCISSSLAVYKYFKNCGKKVHVFLEPGETIRQNLYNLPNISQINKHNPEKRYDMGIAVDCATIARIGKKMSELYSKKCDIKVAFDHHKSHIRFSDILVLEETAASTTQILYKFFEEHDKTMLDSDIASCLYAGIVTDSGNFSYSSTSAETFNIALKLVESGVDNSYWARTLYLEKDYNSFCLSLKALNRIDYRFDKKLAIIYFEKEDFEQTNTDQSDTEGVITSLINIKEVQIAMSLVRIGNAYKIGIRSIDDIDCSLIAEEFGGGGHRNASGCRLFGDRIEVIEKLVKSARQHII